VLSVKVGSGNGGDEELGAVGAWRNDQQVLMCSSATGKLTRTSIGHAQQERLLVLELKVLILELLSIDALTTGSVASSEITTLDHERLDDTVETRALVVERLAILSLALLACAQCAEVIGSLRNNIVVLRFE